MRVSRTSSVKPAARTHSVATVEASASVEETGPVRSVQEVAAFLGIPEVELSANVRRGLDKLISEVDRLRRVGEAKDRRIQHLEQLADEDPLMPILNRRAFVRELNRMMAYAERYHVPSSVLYFDVNGMKAINDRYGHAAGDAALGHIADLLLDNVRSSDVVGRLGGDEFGVLLAQADETAATLKGQQLARLVAKTSFSFRGQTLSVDAAVGAFSFDGTGEATDILDRADRAMYERKRAERKAS